MFEIRHYLTSGGKGVIADWLRKLRDMQAKTAIIRRLNRLEQENFGDFKLLLMVFMNCVLMLFLATEFIMSNLKRPYCGYYVVAAKNTRDRYHLRMCLLA